MTQYKTVTHGFAAVIVIITTFFTTPAGTALLAQYPHVASIITGLLGLIALYHTPVKGV